MPAFDLILGPIIAAGESVSDTVDCTGGRPVRLTLPAQWTSAALTFQISSDGEGFNDLCDFQGKEITISVKPGGAVVIPDDVGQAMAFFRVRSGTSKYPVAQEAQRDFAIAIDKHATTTAPEGEPKGP